MRTRLATVPLLTLLLLSGCAHGPASPTQVLEDAARRGVRGDARSTALAGFHALLVEGKPGEAQSLFDAALAKDGADAYALWGQHLMARRRARPELALEAALTLVEKAPAHPLSAPAARYVLDWAGQSSVGDDALLARVPRALGGTRGDTAQLLRASLAAIHEARGEEPASAADLAALGVPRAFTVVGPLSAYELLEYDAPLEAEKTGSLAGAFQGPYGPVHPRTLPFPDGRLSLAHEGAPGDVYLVAVDVEVPEGGTYVLRTLTPAAHKVYLDGTKVVERRPFARAESSVSSRGVDLSAGRHRVLVKMVRGDRSGVLTLALMRADGRPARLTLTPASGPAPRWSGVGLSDAPLVYPEASDLYRALLPEAGDALARVLAARDGMGRDRDGAKRLLAPLEPVLTSPAFLVLRAEVAMGDRTVPIKVAQGRITRDLEAAVSKDPGEVAAHMARALLALEAERPLDAAASLEAARKESKTPGAPVLMTQARVALALEVAAQADARAREALEAMPGLCEAAGLRYDIARRRDALAEAEALLTGPLARCPGALARTAEHARLRGRTDQAVAALRKLAEREPTSVATAVQLSQLLSGLGRHDEAARVLEGMRAFWPRNAGVLKRLADARELAGALAEALALREEALRLDGTDLALRRIVERARTGKELLADVAIDAKAAIAAYEANRGSEDAAAVFVLDAGAVRVYPDGTQINRIHTIQKVLQQSGVDEVAEASLPPGAQVLALRTLKADGRVLEPEVIEGKDSVSLPGVQVGDYVQTEYLLVEGPRAPGQPGFAASPFYFQIARQPNAWTTYTVIAPRELGMQVDAHNVKAAAVRRDGELDVFVHEQRHVPPYIPEPDGPPSGNEYLPFVQVGAGAQGLESLVRVYSDAFLENGALTFELERFAREAAGDRRGVEAVQAVYEAVSRRMTGRDGGLTQPAAASLATERGSRLWVMKAALEAVGVPTRLALVRTFHTDPAEYRFPNAALLTYVALRAEVPGHGPVWLDPAVRFAPFGELPEAASGQEAYLMPEPGRALEKVRTPEPSTKAGKQVTLKLKLDEDGTLSGTGVEFFRGFEAAQLAEALESMAPDKRKQAVEQNLSRYFGGAELSSLEVDMKREVGGTVTLRYGLKAPRAAHLEGEGRMVLSPVTFPAALGRRFVSAGKRSTPLFVEGVEESSTRVTLELPQGWKLSSLVPPMSEKTPFGDFRRAEKLEGNVLTIDEAYRLERGRVSPEAYAGFTHFAGNLDLLQTRDFTLVKQ
ncbi:MAG: hypothetical protein L0Y66_03830 [Myxococcaceae bacterium]|nr:hypothetical protein [Myxococcaceae bacterium]